MSRARALAALLVGGCASSETTTVGIEVRALAPECEDAPCQTSPPAATVPCDPLAPICGLGEKCNVVPPEGLWEWFEPQCVQTMGTRAPGEACTLWSTGQDECAPGSWCWAGRCRSYCDPAAGCGTDDHVCLGVFEQTGLCMPACAPLDYPACGLLHNCAHVGPMEFACLPIKKSTPNPGSPCNGAQDCGAGLTCRNDECFFYCDLGGGWPTCSGGTSCEPMLSGMQPAELADLGVCL